MDFSSLKENFAEIEKLITTKINTKTIGEHSHPPMIGIHPNCIYCKLYGNVFENGPSKNVNTDVKDIIFSVYE